MDLPDSEYPRARAIDRRTFAVTTVAAVVLGGAVWVLHEAGIRVRLRPSPAPRDPAPPLRPDELEDVDALALVLFPATDRVPADLVTQSARFWVQGRMRRMSPPPPYREGLKELNVAAGARFSAIATPAADRVVTELMRGGADSAFRQAAADLLEGLYAALPGWRLVGYAAGPGYAAGAEAYTTAP